MQVLGGEEDWEDGDRPRGFRTRFGSQRAQHPLCVHSKTQFETGQSLVRSIEVDMKRELQLCLELDRREA